MEQHIIGHRRAKSAILWVITLIWMGMIFAFSAQPGEESAQVSTWVGRFIGRLLVPGFTDLPAMDQEAWAIGIDFFVRKGAHMSVYTVLGFLLFQAVGKRHTVKLWLLAVGIGVLYAISDELHQYFVPGRACQIRDMIIDSCGVLLGTEISVLWNQLIQRQRKNTRD